MRIAVIKYNAGNIQSVENALLRLGIHPVITDDPDSILAADKVIFPGVGEASSAMRYLEEHQLSDLIRKIARPLLGICLGLQLLCDFSEENDTNCLGVFNARVQKFPPQDKVPHMGWNTITNLNSPLFREVNEGAFVYFVHSYYAQITEDTAAQTQYIYPFSSAMQKNNFYAVQFHPEKSGKVGEQILRNFIEL